MKCDHERCLITRQSMLLNQLSQAHSTGCILHGVLMSIFRALVDLSLKHIRCQFVQSSLYTDLNLDQVTQLIRKFRQCLFLFEQLIRQFVRA